MNQRYIDQLWIILLAGLFFIPFLGGVHLFDWDEINFAECAREMLAKGEFLRVNMDYLPFWEKPPLFFWLQAGAMHVFGIGEYAARFPNAIFGIGSLVLIYQIGARLYNRQFAFLWALAYFGSVLPHLYAKSGIIDPVFNFFTFLGLYWLIRFKWDPFLRNILLSGLFIGLAIMTKGPVAYLIIVLTVGIYGIMSRFKDFTKIKYLVTGTLAALAVTGLWLGVDLFLHGPWFLKSFISYQIRLFSTHDAGHEGFMGYHFVVLLVGCFPASLFAIPALAGKIQKPTVYCSGIDFTRWMKILFWVVLVLFSIVQSKIVHYSSLCYFPMTYLAALTLNSYLENGRYRQRWIEIGIWSIGGLYVFATALLPYLGQHIDLIRPLFSKDPFAMANLDALVQWSYLQSLPAVFLLLILIARNYWLSKNNFWSSNIALFLGIAIFVQLTLFFDINPIEAYSQRAALEFYESKIGEDCYIKPVGFKSYAHLFYSRKPPGIAPVYEREPYLFSGKADKPVYLVSKIQMASEMLQKPGVHELYRKNGFVFYEVVPIK